MTGLLVSSFFAGAVGGALLDFFYDDLVWLDVPKCQVGESRGAA